MRSIHVPRTCYLHSPEAAVLPWADVASGSPPGSVMEFSACDIMAGLKN